MVPRLRPPMRGTFAASRILACRWLELALCKRRGHRNRSPAGPVTGIARSQLRLLSPTLVLTSGDAPQRLWHTQDSSGADACHGRSAVAVTLPVGPGSLLAAGARSREPERPARQGPGGLGTPLGGGIRRHRPGGRPRPGIHVRRTGYEELHHRVQRLGGRFPRI